MKIFEIDGAVYAFYEDGTVFQFSVGQSEWVKIACSPPYPEGEKLSEYKD